MLESTANAALYVIIFVSLITCCVGIAWSQNLGCIRSLCGKKRRSASQNSTSNNRGDDLIKIMADKMLDGSENLGIKGSDAILDGLLQVMWPSLSKIVENEILGVIQNYINISLEYIPGIKRFRFTKTDMGHRQPHISDICLLDTSDNSVVLQLNFEYDGDCTLEMEVETPFIDVPMGIKDIKLKGPVRIELKDMVPTLPIVSAVVAYFTEVPYLYFDLTGAADIADIPWIHDTVRKLMSDTFAYQLVDPHRIVIPMAEQSVTKYRWPLPKHVWRITVIEARNLVNSDSGALSLWSGKSDPCVKMFMDIENQDTTKTVNNNLNPYWDHNVLMRTYRDDASIKFSVYDDELVGQNELGYCELFLAEIQDGYFNDWLELKNTDHGELRVRGEKYRPVADVETIAENTESIRMIQIWLGELTEIDTTTENYLQKKDIYSAKVVLNDGIVLNLGTGYYEPALEEKTAKWNRAKHHFGNCDAGKIVLSLATDEAEEIFYQYSFKLNQPSLNIDASVDSKAQFNAHIVVKTYIKR